MRNLSPERRQFYAQNADLNGLMYVGVATVFLGDQLAGDAIGTNSILEALSQTQHIGYAIGAGALVAAKVAFKVGDRLRADALPQPETTL